MCCTHPYVIVATDVHLPALVWMKYQLSWMCLTLNVHSTHVGIVSYCFVLFGFFLYFVWFYNYCTKKTTFETVFFCFCFIWKPLCGNWRCLCGNWRGLCENWMCLCGNVIGLIKTTLQITMLRFLRIYRQNNCRFVACWMKTTINDFEKAIQCAECVFVCCFYMLMENHDKQLWTRDCVVTHPLCGCDSANDMLKSQISENKHPSSPQNRSSHRANKKNTACLSNSDTHSKLLFLCLYCITSAAQHVNSHNIALVCCWLEGDTSHNSDKLQICVVVVAFVFLHHFHLPLMNSCDRISHTPRICTTHVTHVCVQLYSTICKSKFSLICIYIYIMCILLSICGTCVLLVCMIHNTHLTHAARLSPWFFLCMHMPTCLLTLFTHSSRVLICFVACLCAFKHNQKLEPLKATCAVNLYTHKHNPPPRTTKGAKGMRSTTGTMLVKGKVTSVCHATDWPHTPL